MTELLPNVPYYTFEYVWDEPGKRYLGVLAQDLQRVVPDAVYENEDGYLLIDEAALKQIMALKKFDVGSSGYAN